MPRTKIVCTIGPSSESPEVLEKLILNGMNVARLNFSHGSHEEHLQKMNDIRAISDRLGVHIAILQDLCGPKIRVGKVKEPGVRLDPGQTFTLTSRIVEGSSEMVSVSYQSLSSDVNPEDRILLADGMLELVVKRISHTDIICEVITGGILTSNKGINLPTGTIKADAMTYKDQRDLVFGLKNNVDYVALSFVRSAKDIIFLKNIIKKENKNTPVIAKIEKHEALDNIEEIMEVSDGIMVARGDLGVEIPLEKVPNIQKMLVKIANDMGKPVIIATQMLRSMVNSPRPTRAEANDVANAVLDGADAIMLSEETASGDYPVQSVQYMSRIAESAEENYPHEKYLNLMPKTDISHSVAFASCILADHLNVKAIIATTRSGSTAAHISRFRPKPIIIALSPEKATARRLALYWGCLPSLVVYSDDMSCSSDDSAISALSSKHVSKGDLVVITSGSKEYVEGTTNMMRVIKL
ncbi:MAG: pyruvate kinase [Proteobacteria bacterium]|nr:pyruvate kinase [Pseudomonadota bacterium]